MATYTEILARNIRGARTRADLGQELVAARMRALGFDAWIRQTVGATERGRRRPTAQEILGLSYAIGTSIRALIEPSADDKSVTFPSGAEVSVQTVQYSVAGAIDDEVTWEDDVPAFHGQHVYGKVTGLFDRDKAQELDNWIARAEAAVGPWPGGQPRRDDGR
jgi:transcriptional regulator with XRE-family HTH domain